MRWLTVCTPAMDIDTSADPQTKPRKSRIIRRRGKRSNIVFPKFGDHNKVKKKR